MERIFIFTRGGEALFPDPFLGSFEEGVPFDNRVKQDFAPFLESGALFTASDPEGDAAGGASFAVLLLPKNCAPPSNWAARPLRGFIEHFAYSRLLRMYHLAQWRESSRFCGFCGAANGDSEDGEYARLCPSCGRKTFPRISPAVIVLIKNEKNEALLAHNVNFADNIYSLIAGFVEAGESLENAVIREVKEEVAVDITDIKFVTSQSWPFPDSLMVGFTARYKGGAIRCDKKEIGDARWFSRDNLPALPGRGSVSRHIIDAWLSGTV